MIGSLASKDLWAWVWGLLDKLMTHLWLGPSRVFSLWLEGGPLGHLPFGSLLLFLSDTCCIVWGRSSIPHCSARGALAGSETPVCLGGSACIVCTPFLLWGTNTACLGTNTTYLGLSACTVCSPSWLDTNLVCLGLSTCTACITCLGTNTTCLGLSACIACVPPWLDTNPACLGTSTACQGLRTCTACSPSQLGGTNTACLELSTCPSWIPS